MRAARDTSPFGTLFGGEGLLWFVLLPSLAAGAIMRRLAGPLIDPDYWWHLATGRWILDHGRVPSTDPFSYTHGGQNWYAHEWLAETVFALADRTAGYAAVVLITAAIVGAAVWLLRRTARYYGANARTACLITLLGGAFLLDYVAVRPQVWGFALLALLLHELAADDTGHRGNLWHMPLIFALWINVHLSALTGGGVLALYVAHRGLRWWAADDGERAAERRHFFHVFGVAALSALALCLNPRGPALLWFTRVYLTPGSARYTYIHEWQPAPLTAFNAVLLVAGAALAVSALVFALRRRLLWPAGPLLVLAPLALHASRYVPVFGVVAVPAATWLAMQLRRGVSIPQPARLPLPFKLAIGAIAAAGAVFAAAGGGQLRRTPNAAASNYPAGAVAWLRVNLPGARLFNDYDWGGYLIAASYPRRAVYIDGREEMYGEQFLGRFLDAVHLRPGWQATVDGAGAEAALVDRSSPLASALHNDANWTLRYEDQVAAVFVPSGVARKGQDTVTVAAQAQTEP